MHDDIICSLDLTQESSNSKNILGPTSVVEVAYWLIHLPHPQHMNVLKRLVCMEWIWGMWELFRVGLGSQPMHHDIICSPAVTQEFRLLSLLPKFWTQQVWWKLHIGDPFAHPQQHINVRKHPVYV